MNETTVSLEEHLDMVKWYQSALERKAEEILTLKKEIESLKVISKEIWEDEDA